MGAARPNRPRSGRSTRGTGPRSNSCSCLRWIERSAARWVRHAKIVRGAADPPAGRDHDRVHAVGLGGLSAPPLDGCGTPKSSAERPIHPRDGTRSSSCSCPRWIDRSAARWVRHAKNRPRSGRSTRDRSPRGRSICGRSICDRSTRDRSTRGRFTRSRSIRGGPSR